VFCDVSNALVASEVQWKIEDIAKGLKEIGGQRLPPALPLNVDLLGNTQRVFKFDTEVANRAVHLCMTKQKLDCA